MECNCSKRVSKTQQGYGRQYRKYVAVSAFSPSPNCVETMLLQRVRLSNDDISICFRSRPPIVQPMQCTALHCLDRVELCTASAVLLEALSRCVVMHGYTWPQSWAVYQQCRTRCGVGQQPEYFFPFSNPSYSISDSLCTPSEVPHSQSVSIR